MAEQLADPRMVTKLADPRRFMPTVGLQLAATLGTIPGAFSRTIFGQTDAIVASFRDLWPLAGSVNEKTWPLTAGALSIVSTNANDTAAGSGARRVRIRYLLADFTEIEVFADLDGTTPVTEGINAVGFLDAKRVNDITVVSSGNDGVAMNEGTIVASIAGAEQCAMAPGTNRSYSAYFTVPRKKIGVITDLTLTSDAQNTIDFQFRTPGASFVSGFAPTTNNTYWLANLEAGPLPAGTDARVRVSGTGSTVVLAGFRATFFNSQGAAGE